MVHLENPETSFRPLFMPSQDIAENYAGPSENNLTTRFLVIAKSELWVLVDPNSSLLRRPESPVGPVLVVCAFAGELINLLGASACIDVIETLKRSRCTCLLVFPMRNHSS